MWQLGLTQCWPRVSTRVSSTNHFHPNQQKYIWQSCLQTRFNLIKDKMQRLLQFRNTPSYHMESDNQFFVLRKAHEEVRSVRCHHKSSVSWTRLRIWNKVTNKSCWPFYCETWRAKIEGFQRSLFINAKRRPITSLTHVRWVQRFQLTPKAGEMLWGPLTWNSTENIKLHTDLIPKFSSRERSKLCSGRPPLDRRDFQKNCDIRMRGLLITRNIYVHMSHLIYIVYPVSVVTKGFEYLYEGLHYHPRRPEWWH